jgi:hypothetical protein
MGVILPQNRPHLCTNPSGPGPGSAWCPDGDGPRTSAMSGPVVERFGGAPSAHSQRVAKTKPTAMKAMPTIRLYWFRSVISGTVVSVLVKT